jgi:hypothetical protein
VATYGRGLFITDISPLQELKPSLLAEDIHVFEIRPKAQRMIAVWGNYKLYGDRELAIPNEPDTVVVPYYLKNALKDKVKVTVSNPYGEVMRTLEGKSEAGYQTVAWDITRQPKPGEEPTGFGEWRASLCDPGEYVVTVEAGGQKFTRKAVVKDRTGWSVGPFPVKIK